MKKKQDGETTKSRGKQRRDHHECLHCVQEYNKILCVFSCFGEQHFCIKTVNISRRFIQTWGVRPQISSTIHNAQRKWRKIILETLKLSVLSVPLVYSIDAKKRIFWAFFFEANGVKAPGAPRPFYNCIPITWNRAEGSSQLVLQCAFTSGIPGI